VAWFARGHGVEVDTDSTFATPYHTRGWAHIEEAAKRLVASGVRLRCDDPGEFAVRAVTA
jgi:hypothetical protein